MKGCNRRVTYQNPSASLRGTLLDRFDGRCQLGMCSGDEALFQMWTTPDSQSGKGDGRRKCLDPDRPEAGRKSRMSPDQIPRASDNGVTCAKSHGYRLLVAFVKDDHIGVLCRSKPFDESTKGRSVQEQHGLVMTHRQSCIDERRNVHLGWILGGWRKWLAPEERAVDLCTSTGIVLFDNVSDLFDVFPRRWRIEGSASDIDDGALDETHVCVLHSLKARRIGGNASLCRADIDTSTLAVVDAHEAVDGVGFMENSSAEVALALR